MRFQETGWFASESGHGGVGENGDKIVLVMRGSGGSRVGMTIAFYTSIWEFAKNRGPTMGPKATGALIVRTPTKRTPNF